jgi:hypothetical protein
MMLDQRGMELTDDIAMFSVCKFACMSGNVSILQGLLPKLLRFTEQKSDSIDRLVGIAIQSRNFNVACWLVESFPQYATISSIHHILSHTPSPPPTIEQHVIQVVQVRLRTIYIFFK